MKTYIFMLFIISIFSSCSQYAINEDESGETDRINLYMKFQKNAGGEAFDLEYPVVIYSVDKENSAVTEFWYNDGDAVTASLSKGEYSDISTNGTVWRGYLVIVCGSFGLSHMENGAKLEAKSFE